MIYPLPYYKGLAPLVSSGTESTRDGAQHEGVDIDYKDATLAQNFVYPFRDGDYFVPPNTPALAALGGIVSLATWNPNGYRVYLDHGNGLRTLYIHLSKLLVKEGNRVAQATPVGIVGNSPLGRNVAHLHFEIRYNGVPYDPEPYLAQATMIKNPLALGLTTAFIMGLGGYCIYRAMN
jgi:murein DD-endopeptidase MepM/ murein hydrolase activator NlpD